MSTLSGDSISASQLRGKVTVINFWGRWCGPCVREMPDLQTLYEKYRDRSDVRILTIDYRDQVLDLRAWIEELGYSFPVLIDRGYVREAGVTAFPTTWFIRPDGRIAFIKKGATSQLVRAFSWRIEVLR